MSEKRALRARTKWVSHGLSNRVVYGGLHYGGRWLPMAVLNGVNLVGNSLAVTFLSRTKSGMRDNFRSALGVSEDEAAGLVRRVFFEYGRHTIDTWRLRGEAFVPRIETFDDDALVLASARRGGRGFLLVTGHVGNWELGAVTLRRHALTPAVVGQPELSPRVQEMRQHLRGRVGVESIDIGTSMATAFKVRAAVEARARRGAARRPRLSRGPRARPVLRKADAVPALPGSARAVLRLPDPARVLPATSRTAPTTTSGASRSTPIRSSRRKKTPCA